MYTILLHSYIAIVYIISYIIVLPRYKEFAAYWYIIDITVPKFSNFCTIGVTSLLTHLSS